MNATRTPQARLSRRPGPLQTHEESTWTCAARASSRPGTTRTFYARLTVAVTTVAIQTLFSGGCARKPNLVNLQPPTNVARARNDVSFPNSQSSRAGRRQRRYEPEAGLLEELVLWRNRAATDGGRSAALELMRLEAEAGNYQEAHRQADRFDATSSVAGPVPTPEPNLPRFESLTPEDAVEVVSSAAKTVQVVMVNEAHHVPQHRAFTIALLHALRGRGYTYFAAETLYETDTLLNTRGYATRQSGAYVREPLYGELVRTALKLGYHVVAYEAADAATGTTHRERTQAENLIRQTLREDPHAKVLVHAGYRHVNKTGMLAGAKPMAAEFRELTGIDPFTVDQTEMTEHGTPEYENPVYRKAVDRGLVTRPTIFQAADGRPWTLDVGVRNATVFHPRSYYEYGRPTWLRLGGERTPHVLPLGICGAERSCLVDARASGERDDAVPVDQIEVRAAAAVPALMLPDGEFWITARGQDGRMLSRVNARVTNPPSPRR